MVGLSGYDRHPDELPCPPATETQRCLDPDLRKCACTRLLTTPAHGQRDHYRHLARSNELLFAASPSGLARGSVDLVVVHLREYSKSKAAREHGRRGGGIVHIHMHNAGVHFCRPVKGQARRCRPSHMWCAILWFRASDDLFTSNTQCGTRRAVCTANMPMQGNLILHQFS